MTPTLLRRTATTFPALLLLGALGACGGEEPAASPAARSTSVSGSDSPSVPAPDASGGGDRIEGQGYSFAMPEGWEDGTEQLRGMSPLLDSGAFETGAADGFADNVNVIRNDSYPEMGLEEAERQFVEEAGAVATDVQVRDRTEVGGQTAIHVSGRTAAGKEKVRTEQFSLYRDDAWYIVTFSFGADVADAARDEVMATVLGSWEWISS